MGLFEDRLAKRMSNPEFAAAYAEADAELQAHSFTDGWYISSANVQVFNESTRFRTHAYSINTPVYGIWSPVIAPIHGAVTGGKQVLVGAKP